MLEHSKPFTFAIRSTKKYSIFSSYPHFKFSIFYRKRRNDAISSYLPQRDYQNLCDDNLKTIHFFKQYFIFDLAAQNKSPTAPLLLRFPEKKFLFILF